MLFHSPLFLFFAVALLLAYAPLRGARARSGLLLCASYLFYANWDWRYLPLLLLSTAVDFRAGRRLCELPAGRRRRAWLLTSLAVNLGLLGSFKYGNFLLGSLAPLWAAAGVPTPGLPGEIPIGISFYTFQTLSYTIDCWRRRIGPCRDPLDFALYVAFFPQLVAGPIVRAGEILPQLRRLGPLRSDDLAEGLERFLVGLVKKVVVADHVGLFVDAVFASPESCGAPVLWLGAWAFALQIYLDFSAYTDMALGLARALGVGLPENFDAPYLSGSLTEFWRRWHMSLSRWLRDYLYVPLGGSRDGRLRTYRNLLVTMLLGGLWHGAGWNFVLWGGFHGALLAVERALGVGRGVARRASSPLRRALGGLVTFQLVCVGWVLFRAGDPATLRAYLLGMFGMASAAGAGPVAAPPGAHPGLWLGLGWSAVLALWLAFEAWAPREAWRRDWKALHPALQGACLALAIALVAALYVDEVAFLYFQF